MGVAGNFIIKPQAIMDMVCIARRKPVKKPLKTRKIDCIKRYTLVSNYTCSVWLRLKAALLKVSKAIRLKKRNVCGFGRW
jgi:hypothetical protein